MQWRVSHVVEKMALVGSLPSVPDTRAKQVATGAQVGCVRFYYFAFKGPLGKFCFLISNIDLVHNVYICVMWKLLLFKHSKSVFL